MKNRRTLAVAAREGLTQEVLFKMLDAAEAQGSKEAECIRHPGRQAGGLAGRGDGRHLSINRHCTQGTATHKATAWHITARHSATQRSTARHSARFVQVSDLGALLAGKRCKACTLKLFQLIGSVVHQVGQLIHLQACKRAVA